MSITRSALFAALLATAAFGCQRQDRNPERERQRMNHTNNQGSRLPRAAPTGPTEPRPTGPTGMSSEPTGAGGTMGGGAPNDMRGEGESDRNRMARPGTGATRSTSGTMGTDRYHQPGTGFGAGAPAPDTTGTATGTTTGMGSGMTGTRMGDDATTGSAMSGGGSIERDAGTDGPETPGGSGSAATTGGGPP